MSRAAPSRVNQMPQKQDEPQTDWLAWSLQLGLGFLLGSGVGLCAARLMFRSGFTSFDQMLLVAAGVALCCGAFASFYGDRAWMAPSLFDGPEPLRTPRARTVSRVIGWVGAALVFLPVTVNLMTADGSSKQSSSGGFNIVPLLLAAVPGFLIVHALRTGTGIRRFGILDREETPLFFWIYVFVNAIVVMCLLFGK